MKTKSSHAASDKADYIREWRGGWIERAVTGGGRSDSRRSVAETDTGSPVYDRRSDGAERTVLFVSSPANVCARIVCCASYCRRHRGGVRVVRLFLECGPTVECDCFTQLLEPLSSF